jgi:hypothetical protein
MSWFSRIANAVRPGGAAADLADELQFHLDQRAADLVRDGLAMASQFGFSRSRRMSYS